MALGHAISPVNPLLKTDDFCPIIFDAVLLTARLLPLGGILWMSPWLFVMDHDEGLAKGFRPAAMSLF